MVKKHEEIFEQFSATFSAPLIKKWTTMVDNWEADNTKPNPYEEPEDSKSSLEFFRYVISFMFV